MDITAEKETEYIPPLSSTARPSLTAYSGGVDSCFTIFQHTRGLIGRGTRHIGAALFVHGFDIALDAQSDFDRAMSGAKNLLKTSGVPLLTLKTNFKDIVGDWPYTHACGLVSSMRLWQNHFSEALIPSSDWYSSLNFPWGSNPVTDHLLGTKQFGVIYDGAAASRPEKLKQLAQWTEAYNQLRVCFVNKEQDKNCGHCSKCISTLLAIRVNGMVNPLSLDFDPSDSDILALPVSEAKIFFESFQAVYQQAVNLRLTAGWVGALKTLLGKMSV